MTAPRPDVADIVSRYAGRPHPTRLVGAACRAALRDAYSVGLTLAADAALAQRVSLSAAGPLARQGESLQISLGEGPCVQALRQQRPLLVDDLDVIDTTCQWPVFALRAKENGIRAVYALPVQGGSGSAPQAGLVLTLYRDRPGPLSGADLEVARNHAIAADLLLLSAPVPSAENHRHAWLPPTEAVIHQAVGVIGYRHAVSMEEAMARLRAHALMLDTDLDSLAHAVVHEGLELPDPPAPASEGPSHG
ncbi:GAF and ANTAR domain-containing protein [Streptomyces sp. NPDC016845]|uniref:GAF and ANTAR domain-containing protein n=1 Tax=Streptomyces sp. NPDC016845 TaxID=3364972 RepID=UPI0037A5E1CF